MIPEGYEEYRRREYCRDVKCPLQTELETHPPGTSEYESVREKCRTGCLHTTWEFHHWLIEKGYLIVRPVGLR